MGAPAPDDRPRAIRPPDRPATAWVVSPHLLVAQAVAAALGAAGASVETHRWDTFVEEARQHRDRGTLHVVVIFDAPDTLTAIEELSRLLAVADVRVAVVASDPVAVLWGALLEGGAVDIVTSTTSVDQLVEVVERLTTGDSLMEPAKRRAVRAAWVQDLDNRQRIIALMRTLSPRQMRVLELLAAGNRTSEVAELMGVAVGTVQSHVKALRAKLAVSTQLQAVAMLHRVYEVGDEGNLVPRPRQAQVDAGEPTPRR